MRNLSLLLAICFLAPMAGATDWYYAHASAGANNGTSCANAYAFNDGTNGWNVAAKQATGGNGNIIHVCDNAADILNASGTFTVNANGGSGTPITLKFESGGEITSPAFAGNAFSGATAGLMCSGHSNIMIDGGTNGIIANTANGSASLGYANHQATTLLNFSGCTNVEIKNLTMHAFYHAINDTAGVSPNDTVDIALGSAAGINIHNNFLYDAEVPWVGGYSGTIGVMNAQFHENTVDFDCKHIQFGDGSANSTASGLSIYHNTLGPHNQVWSASNQFCHSDGMLLQAVNGGTSELSNVNVYNNTILSDMCSNSSASGNNCTGWIFMQGKFNNVNLFNNVLATTQPTQGFEGFIRLLSGYTDLSSTGGNMTNYNIFNNTVLMNNAAAGVSCTCAGIKLGTNQSSSNSGFKVANNVWSGWPAGGFAIYLNQDDNGDTFNSIFGSNINNDVNFSINKYGHDDQNGQDYNTLASWQATNVINSKPAYDTTTSTGNPLLNGGYIPQTGSSAINLGQNLTSLGITALNADASGSANCRPASGNWGAGAFCFGSEPTVATPTFSPGGGIYSSTQSVTISSATAGATFCWTNDGTTPTGNGAGTCTHGTTYSGAVSVPVSITLKVIGTESGLTDSGVGLASYTIGTVPIPAPNPQSLLGQATFQRQVTPVPGNWQGTYGADGYTIANGPSKFPTYAAFTPTNDLLYTWAANTTDGDAVALPAGGRLASCWYNNPAFSFDVNFTDGKTHAFSVYALDWDSTARAETIVVTDAATGAVLDARTISGFSNGTYLTWICGGHFKVSVTRTAGSNAVISGVFFG